MSKGGSHDPHVIADGCDRCSRAYSLDRHWDCPSPRFWRRWIRGRLSRGIWGRLSWRGVRTGRLRRIRARLLRRIRWFLSGLLRIWLFPVLLLLILIAYTCALKRRSLVWPGHLMPPDGLPAPTCGINHEPYWSSPEQG